MSNSKKRRLDPEEVGTCSRRGQTLKVPRIQLALLFQIFITAAQCQSQLGASKQQLVAHSPLSFAGATLTSSSSLNNNNKQYRHRSAGDQQAPTPLVTATDTKSEKSISLAQSILALPLSRQQSQQQPDLDNVIESTTTTSAHSSNLVQQHQQSNCQLPPTWAGRWYQSNKEPIRITNTEISDKGLCRDQKGDKYLLESYPATYPSTTSSSGNNNKQQPCLVCLVINERHLNVLQYKESSCQPLPANYYNRSANNLPAMFDDDHTLLDSICSDITGDAQLESLFRLDTPAIECPISGSYSFTYENCREPQSSLDSCIDKKQLNFRFAACPDVAGSESKTEVLKCYADWSEGNNYYMIGRLEQASNYQDKGKFRCFVYEKSADGKFIQMAQSVEESCYGLINANEGPKTLRLAVKPPAMHKCQFPSYIQAQSENWLSVDNSLIYMFNQNSTKYQVKETKEGTVNEEATCLQQYTYPQIHPLTNHHHSQHATSRSINRPQQAISNARRYPQAIDATETAPTSSRNEAVYLVQITKNCHTANYCVRFHKRSNGIVQIDYFNASSPGSIDGPCRNAFTEIPQTQIITSTNLERQRCPFDGAYTIEAPIESDLSYNPSNIFICPRQSFLTAQCDHLNRLRIHSRCSPQKQNVKNLYCLGRWNSANGLVRLVLDDDDRQRYSAWYREYPSANQDDSGATSQQAMTRSQQLLAGSASSQQQSIAPLPHIVDMQITLITPLPHPVKSMQVRLIKRSQCSELRGYSNSQGPYANSGGSNSISTTSMQQSYTSAATTHNAHSSTPQMMMMIVILLSALFTFNRASHH